MRTKEEILSEMKTAYIQDATVRDRYSITGDGSFDDYMSPASIEAIIFNVVSYAIYLLEFLFVKHRQEVEAQEDRMRIGTIDWWVNLCRNFQYGIDLIYDEETKLYKYEEELAEAKIIKYAAVREGNQGLLLFINSADAEGFPIRIDDEDERNAFANYLKKMKIAGMPVIWGSYNSDRLSAEITVVYNPLILDSSGNHIINGNNPVQEALHNYLQTVAYGVGSVNKTQILNSVEQAVGVVDAYVTSDNWLQVATDAVPSFSSVVDQNYQSYGGSFIFEIIQINYIAHV